MEKKIILLGKERSRLYIDKELAEKDIAKFINEMMEQGEAAVYMSEGASFTYGYLLQNKYYKICDLMRIYVKNNKEVIGFLDAKLDAVDGPKIEIGFTPDLDELENTLAEEKDVKLCEGSRVEDRSAAIFVKKKYSKKYRGIARTMLGLAMRILRKLNFNDHLCIKDIRYKRSWKLFSNLPNVAGKAGKFKVYIEGPSLSCSLKDDAVLPKVKISYRRHKKFRLF